LRNQAATKQTKSERTRQRLLVAAAKVIGRYGYAKASVSRITMEARIASGGFYYYFETREEMFEELLPALGRELLSFIGERLEEGEWGLEREVHTFEAYLEFLKIRPEAYRIFSEAYVYARTAYNRYIETIIDTYVVTLRKQIARGLVTGIDERDIELLVHYLAGVRIYVSQYYLGRDRKMPDDVRPAVELYRKLIAGQVFKPPAVTAPSTESITKA
jgi:AcrR family transcriptional regulator